MDNNRPDLREYYILCLKVAMQANLKYDEVANRFIEICKASFITSDSPKDKDDDSKNTYHTADGDKSII